ncbi:MAG: hypothetical protein V4496_01410 [Pseudomonadota bacterium]
MRVRSQTPCNTRLIRLFFYVLAASFIVAALLYRNLPWLDDDGAFFLRYAVNMTHGAFWKYNLQDPPIWGASAPLWPLLIAPFIKLGLNPVFSMHLVAMSCYLVSTLLMAVVFEKRFSIWISLIWIVFIGLEGRLDGRLLHFIMSGLETPLTVLLLSFAFVIVICNTKNSYVLALTVALLAINKIDLIPCAGILYLTCCFQNKKCDKLSLLLISLITLSWYGFAWYYFGAPVPNSFMTKAFHQEQMPQVAGHLWIIKYIFKEPKLVLALFLFGIYFSWKNNKYFTIFALSIMAIHTLAYSIKPPFEEYRWYIMPTLYTFWTIIVFGLGSAFENHKKILPYCMIILTAYYSYHTVPQFITDKQYQKRANLSDQDRALAGVWVNEHTPPETTVYTGWGLPTYYSQRYVYDFSFLNRPYEPTDLVLKYKPDIIIFQGYTFGPYLKSGDCNNLNMENWPDYVIIKTFTEAYKADKNANYCFFVAKRKDFITN